MLPVSAVLVASLLVNAGSPEGDASPPEGHTYPLFDGESLAGWTIENDCAVEVRDGMLLLKEGNGWLRSHHTYGDFRLHVEWQALQEADYDAGIYIRTLPGGSPFPRRSYQLNLLQGKEGVIGNLPGTTAATNIRPAGQWNTFDISVVGDTVELTVNGRPAYKVGGLEIARGHVGLQVEVPKGGQFLVRSVRITELGHRSLFDGKQLAHWEGAGQPAEVCWEVRDGLLHCTKGRGPWLRSREEFDDFNLRLDYRLIEGGNSGVYVRVPADGNHHRDNDQQPPAGFEVQILDDSAAKHRSLKDYQYSASVYDIAGADPRVSKTPGEWNTLEINCRGYDVTTIHNGVTVVDLTADTHPAIMLRSLRGYLGLQNHGGGVAFRNLRVGPPVEAETVATAARAVASGAQKQRVYIGTYTRGDSRGIYAFDLDLGTGALEPRGLAAELRNPSFLALHPNGRFLYSVSEVSDAGGGRSGGVSAFAIDSGSGRLQPLNSQPSGGAGPCHLVVDHSGRSVLVANYGGGSVSAIPIAEDGRLKEPGSVIQHEGKSVNPRRQEAPHAHSINVDKTNRFAVAADLGLDKLLVYRLDPAAGKLTPHDPPHASVDPGAGPRHFAFHPTGRFAYVINELASTVTAFTWDADRGVLETIHTVPTLPHPVEGNSTAEVQVHPSGRFLYGSNRGHDSIAIFQIDSRTGRLTAAGHQKTGGQTPRNFGIDPTGRYLLAANQNSDTVVVFRINGETGGLEPTGTTVEVPAPVCVKFLALE